MATVEPRSPWILDVTGPGESPLWVRTVTTPLSWLYGVGVYGNRKRFDWSAKGASRLPGEKTISVGNLAVGGTGKSPVAILLARALLARGKRPAILARGYRSGLKTSECVVLRDGKDLLGHDVTRLHLDEARMQSAVLPGVPVVVGAERHAAALQAIAVLALEKDHGPAEPTHWILDDGFQHRGIHRDVDLVLLDGTRPFGNGHLLPRGPLRESALALARATHVLLTRVGPAGVPDDVMRQVRAVHTGEIMSAKFVAGALVPMTCADAFDATRHAPALVATGIAKPERFLADVRSRGVKVDSVYVVGDHRPFEPVELARRAASVRSVVTTAKDYWRDPSVFAALSIPVFVLELAVEADLDALLAAVI